MSNRSLQLFKFWYQLFLLTKKHELKWYGQERRRRFLWISFQLAVLLKLFFQMIFVTSLWKCKRKEFKFVVFVGYPWEARCCNWIHDFSVTKRKCYKDFFLNSFYYPTFRTYPLNYGFKWFLNLELIQLIPSSERQNDRQSKFCV